MTNVADESLQELFIALTTRWRKDNGALAIGVPKRKLLKTGEFSGESLDELLTKLRVKVQDLGLELVEYSDEGEMWYAVRSAYACPSELSTDEEGILGTIISCIQNSEKAHVPLDNLKQRLVMGKYFSAYRLDRILKSLEHLGYIRKKNKYVQYGPRTLLEFSPESLKHISEQADRLIF